MNLLVLNLNKNITKTKIANLLSIKLNKGIENGYYGYNQNLHIVLVPFSVLAIIANDKEMIVDALRLLDISIKYDDDTNQDYIIKIDNNLNTPFVISNDVIILKETSVLNLNIIALAVAQSVGLEKYEKKLDVLFAKCRGIIDQTDNLIYTKRSHVMVFAKHLVLTRHDMVSNLLLLDKPNILWDNEEAESLYNSLTLVFELYDRHEIALTKLSQLQEDIVLVMDIINHKRSEFLEWIIIILILVEIIMGFIGMM